MILSRKEILKAVKEKRVSIEPFDEKLVGPCSVDLHLGKHFRILRKTGKKFEVTENANPGDYSKTITVGNEGFVLKSRELALGVTKEKIKLSNTVCARIDGRSRFARMGLIVHLSSSLIQPGVDNVQVLELFNASPNDLLLKPGLRVCQVVFEELLGSASYSGLFSRQTKP